MEGFDFPGCDGGGGEPTAVLVSTALQTPPWTTTEMIKPQVCLEGSFSLGMFGRLFSGSSRSLLCLRRSFLLAGGETCSQIALT